MSAQKGQGGVYLRGDTYWIRYSHRGEKHRESSASTRRSDAVALLQRRLAEIHGGRFAPAARVTTVAVILDLVVADYKAQGRRSLPRCELACKQVTEALGDTLARDLTYSDLNTYVGACRARGWQPATIWYNLAILRRAYTLAGNEGLVASRPKFPAITVDNARQGFFERADFENVRAELQSETAKNVVTFAYLTGWRTRSEILRLTWDRVDFAAGVVRLEPRQSKNGDGRPSPSMRCPSSGPCWAARSSPPMPSRRSTAGARAGCSSTGTSRPAARRLGAQSARSTRRGDRRVCGPASRAGSCTISAGPAVRNLVRRG